MKKKEFKFLAIPEDFVFIDSPKISISKSELIKAVNVEAKSEKSRILLSPISYDSKVKDEDKTVNIMEIWLDDQQQMIEKELNRVYKGSF